MTPRTRRILRAVGFGAFYLFSLITFAYVTFPYDRLRERLVQEFNQRQIGPDAMRLEVDELDSYWFSGVEAEGIRLIPAAKPTIPASVTPTSGSAGEAASAPKPRVMTIDSAHVRLGLLGLLVGSKRLSFGAEAFGGTISGSTKEDGDGSRRLELELSELALSEAPLLSDAVGLPLAGTMSGQLDLTLPEGKLAKAEGKVQLKVEGLSAGDGKAKIRDTIALPKIDAGTLELEGEITAGQLKITKFESAGPHLDLVAEGSVRLRDPAMTSLLNLTARFRFNDRYKNQNEITKSLFGAPGSTIPGLFDMDPKIKRAKRQDGFYGWRVSGMLSSPSFMPNPTGGGTAKAGRTGAN